MLLATDLHAGNVLRAEREPWLVIDPKPFVGDPTYDALQHMLNCDDRLRADPVGLVTTDGWTCSTSTPNVSGSGCSPAAWRSRPTGRAWRTSRAASLRHELIRR